MLPQIGRMLRQKLSRNTAVDSSSKRLKTDDSQNDLLDLSVDNCRPSEVSEYFPNLQRSDNMTTVDSKVLQLQVQLINDLKPLNIIKPPIEYVYNPLEYAFKPNEIYIKKYCTTTKKLLFVGMNPGPFGMCQTGIPFGDPQCVRDWLKIEGEVLKPTNECPQREVLGFSSSRNEQSGLKFWGLLKKLCGSPENFFKHSFVINFCPLAFMKGDGKNVTPPEIKDAQDRNALESICGVSYLNLIELLKPEAIIAIGRYVETKTNNLFRDNNVNVPVFYMPHPSPRVKHPHPWPERAESFLQENNLLQYFTQQ